MNKQTIIKTKSLAGNFCKTCVLEQEVRNVEFVGLIQRTLAKKDTIDISKSNVIKYFKDVCILEQRYIITKATFNLIHEIINK